MQPDEAVDLLVIRSGQQSDEGAYKLAEELGYLPLALAQAAAYIEESRVSFSGYLEIYHRHQAEMLNRNVPLSDDYPATVATTWEIAFQTLQAQSPAAVSLLRLCAFLSPDDIPLEVLQSGVEYLPDLLAQAASDSLVLSDAVVALRRYSLAERDSMRDSLSVHRLVQAVTGNRLAEDEQRTWANAALKIVDKAFPEDGLDVRTWSECSRLLPHALTIFAHVDKYELEGENLGRLLDLCGVYQFGRALFREAKELFERALAVGEAIYGPDHSFVARALNDLGVVEKALGDFQKARVLLERALTIDEATYGPDHPDVARDLNNLGNVLSDLGDSQKARVLLERALTINEATYGPDHPDVATSLNSLGGILSDLGDSQKARVLLERALTIDEATYGPDHPDVATNLRNLGSVLRDLKDFQKAHALFERALTIDEATYGPDHPRVATSLNNLGILLKDRRDFQKARVLLERALTIDEATYGPDHPNVAFRLRNLGNVLRDLEDFQKARVLLERALLILQRSLPKNHPRIVATRNNLTDVRLGSRHSLEESNSGRAGNEFLIRRSHKKRLGVITKPLLMRAAFYADTPLAS